MTYAQKLKDDAPSDDVEENERLRKQLWQVVKDRVDSPVKQFTGTELAFRQFDRGMFETIDDAADYFAASNKRDVFETVVSRWERIE